MKRIFSIMVALIMVFALGVTAMAAEEPTIKVSTVESANPGDEVTVIISLENNPGIAALKFGIEFDETRLEKVKFTGIELDEGGMGWEKIGKNNVAIGQTEVYNEDDEPIDYTGNDDIVKLVFKVKDDAPAGFAEVTVERIDAGNSVPAKVEFVAVKGGVSIACPHTNTEVQGAVPASCKDGHTGKTVCLGCGATLDEGEVIPGNGKHTGGAATCEKGAVCVNCGVEYTEPKHGATEVRDAKTAYCKEEGYTGDTWCTVCETMIEKGEAIPKDENNHYNDYPAKDPERVGVKEATCTTPGFTGALVHYYCGHWIQPGTTTPINPDNHKDEEGNEYPTELDETTKVAPDCKNDGKEADTVCSGCKATLVVGATIPATGNHGGGEANCQKGALCAGCGTEYTAPDPDVHVNTEVKDAKKETCGEDGYTGDTYCKDCGAKAKEGEVIPATGEHKGGKATCSTLAICTTCGDSYGEFDKDNHEKEYSIVKEPTCTEVGERAVTCKCGTDLPSEEIEALGHEYGDWVVVKPATKKEEGSKERTCERCGDVESAVIPKIKDTENSIIIDLNGKGQTGEESNPNTGAPVFGVVALAACAAAVIGKKH